MNSANLVEIFCLVDEFSKEFDKVHNDNALAPSNGQKRRNRAFRMSDSEVITIMIMFHLRQFRNLKHFYINYIQAHCQSDFPRTVSYNRFVELQQANMVKMSCFLKMCRLGDCTGVSFIDSTPISVCHIKREHRHKTLRSVAAKGRSTMGWFFGFKLHLIVNDRGEILEFMLTPANTDDREPLSNKAFHERIFGKIFADKGYISQSLFEQLFVDGIHLVTKPRKNMKNSLMLQRDKILLRKRFLIETINDQLKNICQIEHTRHRSLHNFLNNMVAGLIAYSFLPKKPSLNIEIIQNNQITTAA